MSKTVDKIRELSKKAADEKLKERQAQLQRRLELVVESSHYTAPEAMHFRWGEVAIILEEQLGEPDTEWKKNIQRIFNGVSDDK